VECELRSINNLRVSVNGRAVRPALWVTAISDDGYRSATWVIMFRFGTSRSTGENFGCTWESCQTNAGITRKYWEMSGLLLIFIERTGDVIWNTPDVNEQWISLNGEFDAWIIVHYNFWITLAIIFPNIEYFATLHKGTKDKGKWFKHKCRNTETITQLHNPIISIKYGVNVMHSISHLIRSDESRNTQFINVIKMLEALLVFADYSHLESGWNWFPILSGWICNI